MNDVVPARSKLVAQDQYPMATALAFPEGTKIRRDNNQGTITFLRAKNLSKNLEKSTEFRALQDEGNPAQTALAFIRAYRTKFGLLNPDDELIQRSVNHDSLGYKQIRFRQFYTNIPVWNAEILVQLDQDNHVTLIQGHYIKTPIGLTTQPNLNKQQVFEIVANLLEIDQACKNCKLQTVIYAPHGNAPRLAFQISVNISLTEGWVVIIDAYTGSILNKISTVYSKASGGK